MKVLHVIFQLSTEGAIQYSSFNFHLCQSYLKAESDSQRCVGAVVQFALCEIRSGQVAPAVTCHVQSRTWWCNSADLAASRRCVWLRLQTAHHVIARKAWHGIGRSQLNNSWDRKRLSFPASWRFIGLGERGIAKKAARYSKYSALTARSERSVIRTIELQISSYASPEKVEKVILSCERCDSTSSYAENSFPSALNCP